MNDAENLEVWKRLVTGRALDGLELPKLDGRWDLSGLQDPEPASKTPSRQSYGGGAPPGFIQVKNLVWKNLHFSSSKLKEIRFFDTTFENCVFSRCICAGWRVWGSSFLNTRFEDTDLRRAALGGLTEDGRSNLFRNVDFVRVDLRDGAYLSSKMENCRFLDANLKELNFWGTRFENCVFSGLLDSVIFNRHELNHEHLPPNEMKNVSFLNARFRFVEFRKLDMHHVEWPHSSGHVVVKKYREKLECMVEWLRGQGTESARVAAAAVAFDRKWAGDRQNEGVLSKDSFPEDSHWELVMQSLAECGQTEGY